MYLINSINIFRFVIMTSRAKTTDEEYEKLMSGGGKKQSTLSKEKSILTNFKKDLAENNVELEGIKDDTEALSKYVGMYLNNIRVAKSKEDKTLIRPKLGYFNVTYSHLKTALKDEINKDLNHKTDFKKLHQAVAGIRATIKAEGRGNTTHTPRLPQEVLNAIYSLFANVQAVMQARSTENRAQYEIEVKKLPTKYRYIFLTNCLKFYIYAISLESFCIFFPFYYS